MNRDDAIRELNESAAALQRMMGWREAQRRAARFRPDGTYRPADSANRSIAEAALIREPIPGGRGAELWITYTPGREEYRRLRTDPILSNLTYLPRLCDPDALNGYVAFPKRTAPRVPKNSTGNIVQYIPVHGGITWARKDSFMAVWGFDTQHHNSEREPRTDQDWIRANCLLLYTGLMHAGSFVAGIPASRGTCGPAARAWCSKPASLTSSASKA